MHETLESAVQGMVGVVGPVVGKKEKFHLFGFSFTRAKFFRTPAIRIRAMKEPAMGPRCLMA
jgi:hypothetical protein